MQLMDPALSLSFLNCLVSMYSTRRAPINDFKIEGEGVPHIRMHSVLNTEHLIVIFKKNTGIGII